MSRSDNGGRFRERCRFSALYQQDGAECVPGDI